VSVPLYACRAKGRTRAPARAEVFPLHPECRSSELLLEWESRLGCQLPFRQAEASMDFFSHGVVRIEDTTISRHLDAVGSVLDRSWTCRTPRKVAKLLANRTTRDLESGKPLLYISCDAHALRRAELGGGSTWVGTRRAWRCKRRLVTMVWAGAAFGGRVFPDPTAP